MPKKKAKLPLSKTHPKLAKEADGWDPSRYTFGSKKRLQWQCKKGHTFEALIQNRVRLTDTGCPICSGKKCLAGFNDLVTTHPELARQAHDWDATTFTHGSDKKLPWKCSLGHIWETSISHRTINKSNCPTCWGRVVLKGFNDLASKNPELAKEADGWDPTTVTASSGKNLSWKCNKGHRWNSSVYHRNNMKSGCPYCAGKKVLLGFNDLATTHPHLAKESDQWDPTKVSKGFGKKLNWKCPIGHRYRETPNKRSRGDACPYCSGHKVLIGFNDFKTTNPELIEFVDGWDPTTVTSKSDKRRQWKCSERHSWKTQVKSITLGTRCPTCAKYGFDPNKDAWLYLMGHEALDYLQIGITNYPDQRLIRHQKDGWELIELRGPMEGYLTADWETSILRMLRAKKAEMGPSKQDLNKKTIVNSTKFVGTEIWNEKSFPVKSIVELMRLTDEFEDNV